MNRQIVQSALQAGGVAAAGELFFGKGTIKRTIAVGAVAGGAKAAIDVVQRSFNIMGLLSKYTGVKDAEGNVVTAGTKGPFDMINGTLQELVNSVSVIVNSWDSDDPVNAFETAVSAAFAYWMLSPKGLLKKTMFAGVAAPFSSMLLMKAMPAAYNATVEKPAT